MSTQSPTPLTCAIIDAARIFGEMDTAQKLQSNFLSLFMGQSEELLSSVAPYLFPFQINTEFGSWLLEKGWGHSWGMFIQTTSSLEELRKHFRKFLMVRTEDGKELYFRFYDPRVLRIFMPTCDEQQLKEFFGPVTYYAMEDEDPSFALIFRYDKGRLEKERIPRTEFLKGLNNGIEYKIGGEQVIVPMEQTDAPPKPDEENKPPDKKKPNEGWSFLVE